MSYIRCLSNPEGLYIYGDGSGILIHYDGGSMYVPEKDFHKVGLEYVRYHWAEHGMRSGDLVVREVEVIRGTDMVYFEPRHKKLGIAEVWGHRKYLDGPRTDHKVLFSYKGKSFIMWRVTWDYIAQSIKNYVEWEENRKKKRKAKKSVSRGAPRGTRAADGGKNLRRLRS